MSRSGVHRDEVVIAAAAGVLVQLGLVATLASGSRPLVEADISDKKSKPIAVAITPILDAPLARLGTRSPAAVPQGWARAKPKAAEPDQRPLPSPAAKTTPDAIPSAPVSDAGPPVVPTDAAADPNASPLGSDAAAPSDAGPSTPGDPNGVPDGSDDLRARAVSAYRAQINAWFSARFNIRGKIPFERLRTLRTSAVVTLSQGRTVSGFTLTQSSGDPVFDAEVRSTLAGAQSSGVVLPAPPPMYEDILGSSLTLNFQCSVQKACE